MDANANETAAIAKVPEIGRRLEVVTGLHVEISPRRFPYWFRDGGVTVEEREKWLKEWADELRDFIRDHRSRDETTFEVVREKEWQCSACGREWETMEEDGKTKCAGCGVEVAP